MMASCARAGAEGKRRMSRKACKQAYKPTKDTRFTNSLTFLLIKGLDVLTLLTFPGIPEPSHSLHPNSIAV
jgi:hypothetical protein